jgi:hypothetical protein
MCVCVRNADDAIIRYIITPIFQFTNGTGRCLGATVAGDVVNGKVGVALRFWCPSSRACTMPAQHPPPPPNASHMSQDPTTFIPVRALGGGFNGLYSWDSQTCVDTELDTDAD